MVTKDQRLTVMVIPPASRRAYSFTVAPAWIAAVAIFLISIIIMTGRLWYLSARVEELQRNLGELEVLRRTNRIQQSRIEEMQRTSELIQIRLQELELLEGEIHQINGQISGGVSRSGDHEPAGTALAGRGGGRRLLTEQLGLAMLSAYLPADVRQLTIGKRETAEVHAALTTRPTKPEVTYQTALQLSEALRRQLRSVEHLAERLISGRDEVVDRLDYLARRPSGLPVIDAEVTDTFGWRWSPFGWGREFHDGIDFAKEYGAPVYATADGEVTHAGYLEGGYGNTVILEHGRGFTTLYAHLSEWNVTVGQQVSRGDVIGRVGSTGLSTGPHVHYEVHVNGEPVDPAHYLE